MRLTRFKSLAFLLSALAFGNSSQAGETDSTTPMPATINKHASSRGQGRFSILWSPIWSDQLRSGSSELKNHALPDSLRSTPVSTATQALKISASWKLPVLATIQLQLPVLWREHVDIGPGDIAESKASMTGIGDCRIGGRFTEVPGVPAGFEIGLKFPTGSTSEGYASGPRRGQTVARKSQLGTGSTDLVLGTSTTWLGQYLTASVEYPFLHETGYVPGMQVATSWSYFLTWFQSATPQLRAKAIWEDNETGAKADAANSGSFQIVLQPSLNIHSRSGFGIWTEWGFPALYRSVRGIQTAPGYTFALGIHNQL